MGVTVTTIKTTKTAKIIKIIKTTRYLQSKTFSTKTTRSSPTILKRSTLKTLDTSSNPILTIIIEAEIKKTIKIF